MHAPAKRVGALDGGMLKLKREKASGNLVFSVVCKMQMRRKIKQIEKIG